MKNSSTPSRNLLTTLAVILVVTAFVLVGLNSLQLEKKLQSETAKSYVNGYLTARKTYQDVCPFAGRETNHFSGTVQSTNGTELLVLAESLDTDPLVDGVSNVRRITVTNSTVIQKSVKKSATQLQQELTAYAKLPSPKGPPPTEVSMVQIKLSDIQNGSKVYVESASDVRMQSVISAIVIRTID